MAVAASRTTATITHTGASSTTNILRAAKGNDTDDGLNTPVEIFVAVEATGVGTIDRS